jgi:(2Fe-2S) ferredoxin
MAEALMRSNVMICEGTGCAASQAREVLTALKGEIQRHGLDGEIRIVQTGCRGFCAMGPIVMVYPEGIFYCQVKPEDVSLLVEETLLKGRIVERLAYREPLDHRAIPHYSEIPFYTKQKRIALRNCGMIDPEDIQEYIARDGYAALTKVLGGMSAQEVLAEMKASGLRGRGGAGFPNPPAVPERQSRLRLPQGRGRRHGLGRHDRGGRRHLHGRVRQVLPDLRHGRKLRQVRALPRRRQTHAGDPEPHLRR